MSISMIEEETSHLELNSNQQVESMSNIDHLRHGQRRKQRKEEYNTTIQKGPLASEPEHDLVNQDDISNNVKKFFNRKKKNEEEIVNNLSQMFDEVE